MVKRRGSLQPNGKVSIFSLIAFYIPHRYEMSNCLFEATLQEIERKCNCTPKYYVDISEGFTACEGKRRKCMNQLMIEMGDQRSIVDRGTIKVF